MGLDLNRLTRITDVNQRELVYFTDELGYYEAYKQHLRVSIHLHDSEFHREAYYVLLIAIECFLKDVFCIFRYEMFGDVNRLGNLRRFDKALKAREFIHDLYELTSVLSAICPALNSDPAFATFLLSLPSKSKVKDQKERTWMDERYDNPDLHIHTGHELMWARLHEAFVALLDTTLGGFK